MIQEAETMITHAAKLLMNLGKTVFDILLPIHHFPV